jgi:hypothetical protein
MGHRSLLVVGSLMALSTPQPRNRHLTVEQSEEWVTGRRYLDMRELEEHRREEREANGVILMQS